MHVSSYPYVKSKRSRSVRRLARYIDGKGVCSSAPVALPVRGSPMFVGAATSTLLNPFCGMVYDVRVYNRALPPVELRPLWGEMSHKLQVSWRAAHPPFGSHFCFA